MWPLYESERVYVDVRVFENLRVCVCVTMEGGLVHPPFHTFLVIDVWLLLLSRCEVRRNVIYNNVVGVMSSVSGGDK